RETFRATRPDVVLCDLKMPGKDGFAVLTEALEEDPQIAVIVLTAYATVESAVRAIKAGAFDYLAKPFTADQLAITVGHAVRQRALAEENRRLRQEVSAARGLEEIVGDSPGIQNVLATIRRIAPTDASVLIVGESGTGKELLARALHNLSHRADGPCVAVDCAALPESLLQNELFGHERGAFTGASARKRGLLELAGGGTLFLDEITELPPALQAKLLRVLQEREFRRLGGEKLVAADFRVIAATNRDPGETMASGGLREDLFYRLNVIPLPVPPLRERSGDIPLLLRVFLDRFSRSLGKPSVKWDDRALRALMRYRWPGNVRELKNLAERLAVTHESGPIGLDMLPEALREAAEHPLPTPGQAVVRAGAADPVPLHSAEAAWRGHFYREYLGSLLRTSGGNVSRAAREAGVSRRTLQRLLRNYPEVRADPAPGPTEDRGES
ncbi:MAG: sigma-54-dependent Fis family transcriptional regulator, partial [Gemmatimonadetes bacterium]|nr:sigma-54-dependent Fis family transcriptional regulator [Gemmatimonadota bacterium]